MSYLGLAEDASAEEKQSNPSTVATFDIHTDLLFDPKKKAFVTDTSLTINPSTGLIAKVYKRTSPLPTQIAPPSIDLRGLTVLPGLVDAHTHILLHAYSETPALSQIRDESLTERTIRATNHCRTALLAGYTTYRDLGTEGRLFILFVDRLFILTFIRRLRHRHPSAQRHKSWPNTGSPPLRRHGSPGLLRRLRSPPGILHLQRPPPV